MGSYVVTVVVTTDHEKWDEVFGKETPDTVGAFVANSLRYSPSLVTEDVTMLKATPLTHPLKGLHEAGG